MNETPIYDPDNPQDRALITALLRMGARMEIHSKQDIRPVWTPSRLHGVKYPEPDKDFLYRQAQ